MKRVIALLVIIILVIGAVVFVFSRTIVSFEQKNIKSIEITELDSGKKVSSFLNDSSAFLVKNTKYKVSYVGIDGYANGSRVFNSSDEMPIKLVPYFSKEKLLSLLAADSNTIHNSISRTLPDLLTNFSLAKEGLLQFGDWYVALYRYKGGYNLSSDSLRIVAKKVEGKWKPVSSPEIFLNSVSYPNIPKDVLEKANAL
ncbi:MAG TPA: hypothetical protein PL051_00470 [Candidatus Saccharibacteria bacterium]|nr:hypothetical protein [Candidatus Saccharibacteria bacterium]